MLGFTTGERGIELIKSFESCRLSSYRDQRGIWTVGWGHILGVKPGMSITQNDADSLLLHDLQDAERAVNRGVTLKTCTHAAFDSLTSFCFNIGAGAFSGSHVLKWINAGDLQQAADGFLAWDHCNGVVNAGLLRRREAERALFLS